MRIIEIESLPNGAHRNQTGNFETIPDGYAVIPDSIETLNFPFGTIETENVEGVTTVTSWTPGTIPETDDTPESITIEERVTALESAVLELALGGAE